jgi:hypothetical protein
MREELRGAPQGVPCDVSEQPVATLDHDAPAVARRSAGAQKKIKITRGVL